MERSLERILSNGTNVRMDICKIGRDYSVMLSGGDSPHIGTAVLALPRPSLAAADRISSTSSVINVLGHKDETLCRYCAERLSAGLNTTVLCAGGVHIDSISPELLEEVYSAVKNMVCEMLTFN